MKSKNFITKDGAMSCLYAFVENELTGTEICNSILAIIEDLKDGKIIDDYLCLFELTNEKKFNDDFAAKITEIINCIEAESIGINEWGADVEEINKILIAYKDNECDYSDKKRQELHDIYEKYKIKKKGGTNICSMN